MYFMKQGIKELILLFNFYICIHMYYHHRYFHYYKKRNWRDLHLYSNIATMKSNIYICDFNTIILTNTNLKN